MTNDHPNVLSVVRSRDDDAVVLTVSGPIDLATADLLREHVTDALGSKSPRLVLDLTDVDFLASVGIQLLVDTHHKIAPGRLIVVADSREVVRPLMITHLNDVLHIVSDLADALGEQESNG